MASPRRLAEPTSSPAERHAPGHPSRADHVRHPSEHPPHHLPGRGPRRDHAPEPKSPGLGTIIVSIILFCVCVPWAVSCAPTIGGMHLSRQLAGAGGDTASRLATALDTDADGIPDAEEDALLKRYAPTALVAADEPSMPASVAWIRARNDIASDGPRVFGQVVPRHPFSLAARQGSRDPKDWVVYGHAFPKAGGGTVLQYWFYFPYNVAPMFLFDHESDWEHVSVELDAQGQPTDFILARHNDNAPGVRVPWNRVPKEGDHPFSLIARGSHAGYLNHAEAPFWERVVDCVRGADGTPLLDKCPVIAWRGGDGPDRPSPIVNVGERARPRLEQDPDGFFMRYAGLWGDPAVLKLFSAAPPGPPYQAGFCADADRGSCG